MFMTRWNTKGRRSLIGAPLQETKPNVAQKTRRHVAAESAGFGRDVAITSKPSTPRARRAQPGSHVSPLYIALPALPWCFAASNGFVYSRSTKWGLLTWTQPRCSLCLEWRLNWRLPSLPLVLNRLNSVYSMTCATCPKTKPKDDETVGAKFPPSAWRRKETSCSPSCARLGACE